MAKLADLKLLSNGNCSMITSSDDIRIVKWTDNNPVYTISTYAGALPEKEEVAIMTDLKNEQL